MIGMYMIESNNENYVIHVHWYIELCASIDYYNYNTDQRNRSETKMEHLDKVIDD